MTERRFPEISIEPDRDYPGERVNLVLGGSQTNYVLPATDEDLAALRDVIDRHLAAPEPELKRGQFLKENGSIGYCPACAGDLGAVNHLCGLSGLQDMLRIG